MADPGAAGDPAGAALDRLQSAVDRLREVAEQLRAADIADAEVTPLTETMLALSREVSEGLAEVLRVADG